MTITHAFTSAIGDGPDNTLVKPSDWNAAHVIDNDTVTYAQIQNVSATDKVLGRSSSGAGDIEEIACTAAGRSVIGASTTADQRTALGLAAIAASGSGADLGAGTVALAALANLATQRVIGRNTAGTGAPEAVTASQLFDWVSSTDGVLLTRTGGSWAALANVGTNGGDLVFTSGTPTTPSAGTVKASGYALGGRQMLAMTDPDGFTAPVQACLGARKVVWWQPLPNSTNTSLMGLAAFSYVGTATARAPAATGTVTGSRRLGLVSGVSAGSIAGARHGVLTWWRGDAAGRGGFHLVWRFNVADAVLVADARMFIGIIGTASAPTNVEPSTLTNLIGVGCNGGDTTMQLYAAGGSAQARSNLGANFPINTTNADIYELHLYCAPNASSVGYTLIRVGGGVAPASGTITNAANLPSSTTLLTAQAWRTNNATVAACALDLHNFYVETVA